MDNEKNDFKREETPIGIKPLEEDNDTNEIKLVRTQSIPLVGDIDLPREKTELYPTREVRVVNIKSDEVVEPNKEVIDNPVPKDNPEENHDDSKPKKKKTKQDLIMYAIMAIIVIVILLLGIKYCRNMMEDDRRISTTKTTASTETTSTTQGTDVTLTTTTTTTTPTITETTTTTSKKTDNQGYTGTTTTTVAGNITKTYVIKGSSITFKNKKANYAYSLPAKFEVAVQVTGSKANVTKVGTPKLVIDVSTIKDGVGKIQVNGTYSGVKITIDPNTVQVTSKLTETTTTTTTKKADVYTYKLESALQGAIYYLSLYKNGTAHAESIIIYTSKSSADNIGGGLSSKITLAPSMSQEGQSYDLANKPTLYFAFEKDCTGSDQNISCPSSVRHEMKYTN